MHSFDLAPDSTDGFDFLVDGQFLRQLIFEDVDMAQREVSLLRDRISSSITQEQIRRLKGELPGPFFLQLVWLYFCPECFDEGCGGVSVRIQIYTDRVVWSDFSYDLPAEADELEIYEDGDVITSVGTLTFDRVQYEAALNRVGKQLRIFGGRLHSRG